METRAQYILVGLFTLTSGAALLLFSLWLTGAGSDQEVTPFEVLFREPVSGLSVGSPVQYSGIRVGEVAELRLDASDPRIVRARIQVASGVPVKTDTVARLTLLNITGASAIELGGGSPTSPALTGNNGVPIIEAAPSSLEQLRITSEELLVSASTLLERANAMFSEDNAARVSRVLGNVDTVTSALAAQQDTIREGLEQLAQSGRAMNELLNQANAQLGRYDESIVSGVESTVAELQLLSTQLNSMVSDNSDSVSSGLQGFAELAPAMRELRSILNSINSLTRELSDNPASFILGNDKIREYQQ